MKCWDTKSEYTSLWQLPKVSSAFKKWPHIKLHVRVPCAFYTGTLLLLSHSALMFYTSDTFCTSWLPNTTRNCHTAPIPRNRRFDYSLAINKPLPFCTYFPVHFLFLFFLYSFFKCFLFYWGKMSLNSHRLKIMIVESLP